MRGKPILRKRFFTKKSSSQQIQSRGNWGEPVCWGAAYVTWTRPPCHCLRNQSMAVPAPNRKSDCSFLKSSFPNFFTIMGNASVVKGDYKLGVFVMDPRTAHHTGQSGVLRGTAQGPSPRALGPHSSCGKRSGRSSEGKQSPDDHPPPLLVCPRNKAHVHSETCAPMFSRRCS